MTSNIRIAALAAFVAIASLTPALNAQSTIRAQVDVPFSFDYGTTHFGHGRYLITPMGEDALMVSNRATSQSAMALARVEITPVAAKSGVATFRKYGDRWFLENVSMAGTGTSISVCESQAERKAARELASRGGDATQVALALLPERAFGK